MIVGRLNQSLKLAKLVLELLAEFALLFVSPALFELVHLRRERAASLAQFFAEARQLGGELADLVGVSDRLVHDEAAFTLGSGFGSGIGLLDRREDGLVMFECRGQSVSVG